MKFVKGLVVNEAIAFCINLPSYPHTVANDSEEITWIDKE